jgi:hypothetical protein
MPTNNAPCKRKSGIDALARKALKYLDKIPETPVQNLDAQVDKAKQSVNEILSDPHKPK